jgi:hypothetical protein
MNRGYHWVTQRGDYTGDVNYWTGTFGWGTSAGNWANAWKAGFAGWDIWGTGTDHPQGSGYIHAQGIVSGQHYATSDGGAAYGWMMVGAGDATANRYWLRGKWGGTTSSWTEMITTNNINSQEVYSSAILRQFNVVYGDNWNDVYTANSFRIGQGHNISGANGPQTIGAYTMVRICHSVSWVVQCSNSGFLKTHSTHIGVLLTSISEPVGMVVGVLGTDYLCREPALPMVMVYSEVMYR